METPENPSRSSHSVKGESARTPMLVYGFLGRAYHLSSRGRRLVQTGDIFWGIILVLSVIGARFGLIGGWNLAITMLAVIVLRFAVIKAYLVVAKEPAAAMPMAARARFAFKSMPPGLVGWAVRTFSIAAGAALVLVSGLVISVGNFSHKELLLVAAFLAVFVAAIVVDYMTHRFMASKDGARLDQ